MASINQFLKQLGTGDSIKDYQHGARIFVDDNYRLSPKYGFLFHVAFDLNTEITRIPRDQVLEMGMIVKTASLPKFSIDTKTMNAYNRPNVVQNKIKYDPITIAFHDDSADIIRDFWYDYYSYYYRDSDYAESVYNAPHKYDIRQQQQWGYTPRQYPSISGTQQFIRAIRIYSLHQKRFTEYTIINPTITSFRHGEHQNGNNELMQHEMTVQYESVKYKYGWVSKETVKGFADLHYDHTPSPLTPAGGGTRSILGPGGLLASIDEVTNDLADGNFLSALFKGGRAFQNFKGSDLKMLAGAELASLGRDVLRGNNPLSRVNIPSFGGMSSIGSFGSVAIGGAIGAAGSLLSNAQSVFDSNGQYPSNYNPQLPPVGNTWVDSNGNEHFIDDDGNEMITDGQTGGITLIGANGEVNYTIPNQSPATMQFQDYDNGSEPLMNNYDLEFSEQGDTESEGNDEWASWNGEWEDEE
jgi:hypothetical protein